MNASPSVAKGRTRTPPTFSEKCPHMWTCRMPSERMNGERNHTVQPVHHIMGNPPHIRQYPNPDGEFRTAKKRTEPMSSLLALVRFISYGRRLKTTVFRLFLLSYGFIPSAMLAYRSLAIGRRCRGCRMRQIHRRGIIRGGIAVSVRIRRLLLCGIGVSIRVRIGVRVPIG